MEFGDRQLFYDTTARWLKHITYFVHYPRKIPAMNPKAKKAASMLDQWNFIPTFLNP